VKECLERSRKITEFVTQESTEDLYLFVDVINHYIYYLSTGDQEFPVSFLNRLLESFKAKYEAPESLEDKESASYRLHQHYTNSIDLLRLKKLSGDPIFSGVNF